jgi:uncharacterized membrane protein
MRERHHEVTRLEGFSDAVFGFALTLLVVSLETPQTVGALRDLMRGFLPFALTFAMVCWIWYEHNVFFRRYGLQDPWTAFLNSVLLFVVLFYVYPLKFLTGALFSSLIWRDARPDLLGTAEDGRAVMLLYSAGVVMIFGCFTLLYRHAMTRADALELDRRARLQLHYGMRSHLISLSLGLVSIAIATASVALVPIAGMIYGLMGPLHAWNGYAGGRAQATLEAPAAAATTKVQAE